MNNYEIYEVIRNPFTFKFPIAEKFEFNSKLEPIHISNSLQMTVMENNGVGIAASQVGINKRIIFVRGLESALFNPRIVETGTSKTVMEEASLSYPGLVVKIKRPEVIRIRYENAYGETETKVFSGLTSRVIQRKIQILDGEVWYKIANQYHLEKAMKKWK